VSGPAIRPGRSVARSVRISGISGFIFGRRRSRLFSIYRAPATKGSLPGRRFENGRGLPFCLGRARSARDPASSLPHHREFQLAAAPRAVPREFTCIRRDAANRAVATREKMGHEKERERERGEGRFRFRWRLFPIGGAGSRRVRVDENAARKVYQDGRKLDNQYMHMHMHRKVVKEKQRSLRCPRHSRRR